MVTIRWSAGEGWHDAAVVPYGPLSFDPATMVLHYGQEIFEGLKAYRHPDGSIASFRPEANAARFRGSASRLAMAELPDELFLASIAELLAVDHEWAPAAGGEDALYLRPFMLATEVGLGVRPSSEYLYALIASPVGPYFADGVKPIDVWLSTEYTRSALGGTGAAKCGGNYAASLLPQAQGAEHGCAQVAYLDAEERTWVDEMGSEQPVLRLRVGRPDRDRHARRSPAASWRASPAIRCWCWPRSWAVRSPSGASRGRSGSRARPTARSPRSSAAAPPR